MSGNLQTFCVTTLADLTGQESDRDLVLPEIWQRALLALPESKSKLVLPTRNSSDPPDRQHALIPKTSIVLKLQPASWHLLKALAKAWSALQLYQIGHVSQAALLFGAALESLGKIKDAIDILKVDGGEYCTYLTVVQAAGELERAIGMYPEFEKVRQAHTHFRSTCDRTSCSFHQSDCCKMSNSEWEQTITTLKERSILQSKPGNCLWIAL